MARLVSGDLAAWQRRASVGLGIAVNSRELAPRMKQRGIGQAVIDRVVRLNPDYHEGCRIRGAHGLTSKSYRFVRQDVSKGTVIRKFGRSAWDRMPPECISKDGRRHYITREAFEDRVWMSERGR